MKPTSGTPAPAAPPSGGGTPHGFPLTPPPVVPLCDIQAQYRGLKDEIDAAVLRVLGLRAGDPGAGGGRVREGNGRVLRGERTASGAGPAPTRSSLALHALDIGPGDEVIVPPFTFFATVGAVVPRRGDAGVRGHRPAHVQPRPEPDRGEDHPEDAGDHPGPPVRPVLRHGRRSGTSRRSTSSTWSRTRRSRSAASTRASGAAARRRRRASASTRRRTSARWATPAW